jgi:hypothetical protein
VSAGQTTSLDQLVMQLQAEPRRDRRYHADCPFCGKEAKKGQKHFSFCEDGYFCWVCEAKGGLSKLAAHIGAGTIPVSPRRAERPQEPRQWQQRPAWYLSRYCEALDRITCWQAYKPLTLESILRWKLGVGMLPASRATHRRLIVPVFDQGQLVAFHGRAFHADDTDAKWLTAGGSSKQVLFNGDLLRPGATVVIVENYIDAILAMQAASEIVAVCGGGASWQDAWTQQIAQSQPERVLVWLDHDLAGNGSRYHQAELIAEWKRRNPSAQHLPEPSGPKIANQLLQAGARATLYEWPKGSALHADIGGELMRDGVAA